jgi:polyisoprenoid-binding protein YceI
MNKIVSLALVALFILSGHAHAADRYVLDNAHTQVIFKADRFGLSNTFGSFADVSGELMLDEKNPEDSSVAATIRVASLRSDNDTREGHLKSGNWLDAEAFPEITFVSTGVEQVDETTAKVTGDLTVRGVTKSVTLDVTLKNMGPDPVSKRKAVGFSATTSLNRHDFGVSIAENLIGADVQIFIETLAIEAE